jgi:hypothetical protein
VSLAGTLGAVVGLFVGVHVFPPTAPVAAIELGLPAAAVGGIVGMALDLAGVVRRKVHRQGDARAAPIRT